MDCLGVIGISYHLSPAAFICRANMSCSGTGSCISCLCEKLRWVS